PSSSFPHSSCEAFLFLPVPFFSLVSRSSCLLLLLFVLHQSGNAYAYFLLPNLILLFPGLPAIFFLYPLKKQLLRTSGFLQPYSFHSLHLLFSFRGRQYSAVH